MVASGEEAQRGVQEIRHHLAGLEAKHGQHELETGLRTSLDMQMMDRIRASMAAWEGEVAKQDRGWGSPDGNRRSQLRYAMRVAREVWELGDGSFNGQGGVRGLAVLGVASLLAHAETERFAAETASRVQSLQRLVQQQQTPPHVDSNARESRGYPGGWVNPAAEPSPSPRAAAGFYAASDVLEEFKARSRDSSGPSETTGRAVGSSGLRKGHHADPPLDEWARVERQLAGELEEVRHVLQESGPISAAVITGPVTPFGAAGFDSADLNGDGLIDRREFGEWQQPGTGTGP